MGKRVWVIGIANSEADGVRINNFYGTTDEVKKLLIRLVNTDKENDEENFEYGTETTDEIGDELNELNAYATYSDYHIDYTAIPWDKVIPL